METPSRASVACLCYREWLKKYPRDAANVRGHGHIHTSGGDILDSTAPDASRVKSLSLFRPHVCAYRGDTCALDSDPCRQPCALVGFARALWWAGYQHWTQEQVLERLCNPREYTSDAEYDRMIEFMVSAHRGAA
jgi:hypothetical protein